GHPTHVPSLFADLRHAAHLDVLDFGRVEVVTSQKPVQHLRSQIVPTQRREGAVPPPDRRAHGIDDVRLHLRQSYAARGAALHLGNPCLTPDTSHARGLSLSRIPAHVWTESHTSVRVSDTRRGPARPARKRR